MRVPDCIAVTASEPALTVTSQPPCTKPATVLLIVSV